MKVPEGAFGGRPKAAEFSLEARLHAVQKERQPGQHSDRGAAGEIGHIVQAEVRAAGDSDRPMRWLT